MMARNVFSFDSSNDNLERYRERKTLEKKKTFLEEKERIESDILRTPLVRSLLFVELNFLTF